MINIEIRNFQSIDELELKVEGFTCVVGRNNIGKSAIIRAIKCALTGAEGTSVVRHDPKVCSRFIKGNKKCLCSYSVKLDFNDGLVVLWEKGDALSRYTIWDNGDKQVYDRVGRHPELPEALAKRFTPVKVGDSSDLLQVAGQYNTVFLLNKSGTVVADTLGDLENLDQVAKATSLVVKDRKVAKSKRKLREGDISDLKMALLAYDGLPETLASVQKVWASLDDLGAKESKIDVGARLLESRNIALRAIGRLEAALEPDLDPLNSVQDSFSQWVRVDAFCRQQESVLERISRLERSEELEIPLLLSIQQAVEEISLLEGWVHRFSEGRKSERALKALEETRLVEEDCNALRAKADQLALMADFHRRAVPFRGMKLKKEQLAAIDLEVPDIKTGLDRVSCMEEFLQRQKGLEESIQSLESELIAAEVEEQVVLDEFSGLGVCPTCTQAITPTHVN